MNGSRTRRTPDVTTDDAVEAGGLWQVVLFNDDHNEADYVVRCLTKVFGHCAPLAEKIMLEAHRRGKAIAEVEDHDRALRHKSQLQSCGLTASIEPVS